MAGIYCNDPQFAHEMHYKGEIRHNMNHGSSSMPGASERAHHHTHHKDKLIEHTMRTERHDYVGSSVNTHEAAGIIGNSKHGIDFKNRTGMDLPKHHQIQVRKSGASGIQKGGI